MLKDDISENKNPNKVLLDSKSKTLFFCFLSNAYNSQWWSWACWFGSFSWILVKIKKKCYRTKKKSVTSFCMWFCFFLFDSFFLDRSSVLLFSWLSAMKTNAPPILISLLYSLVLDFFGFQFYYMPKIKQCPDMYVCMHGWMDVSLTQVFWSFWISYRWS